MGYQDYIKAELLSLVPVLYLIGTWLKKSKFPDRFIPVFLGCISVILSALWVVATSDITNVKEVTFAIFTAFTQGILAAGTSVYANQLYVQSQKES